MKKLSLVVKKSRRIQTELQRLNGQLNAVNSKIEVLREQRQEVLDKIDLVLRQSRRFLSSQQAL